MAEKKSCAQPLKVAGLSVIKACKIISLPQASFYRKTQNWRVSIKEEWTGWAGLTFID
ncbi:hypothetical protein GKR72_07010 [Providencia stuartii]|uniref:Uncharacterized protein n=1 Tax=Providencia stuartii ATCC 25827 TaxID=471874 RepID=A0AA86YYN7_PROST|nr:hypothetical protein PROSTU_01020 [Providencia stuartii ATCC 25827]MBS7785125.1 hypothetical protein [Providencia thailandensis]MTC80900.1 hypothetical protein [Providencia stuartii]MTC92801.1 hypothetical protein [Providencia stuartii]